MSHKVIPDFVPSEEGVYDRYTSAATQREDALCCPIEYNRDLLAIIPQEIIDKDYGCGDPSEFVRSGETVLDLGSGGGKLCYIAAQVVGASGKVIGVDCNSTMLGLARKYQAEVAATLGYANVEFRCGMIQDLQLDLDLLAKQLAGKPVDSADGYLRLRQLEERLRIEQPMISSASIDCVVSNCVLNLVKQSDRRRLFQEIFRVLKPGGRAVISDIVASEHVPASMRNNPALWSGCISGAFREDEFLDAFGQEGFHGLTLAKRAANPWQTVEGIEFRSVTVIAYKPLKGDDSCLHRSVIYKGPFASVTDDDGNVYLRGRQTSISATSAELYASEPYLGDFYCLEPRVRIPRNLAQLGEDNDNPTRRESEVNDMNKLAADGNANSCCGPQKCC